MGLLCSPARLRALGTPALSLVARSLRSFAPQSEDRGAPFGSLNSQRSMQAISSSVSTGLVT